MKEEKNIGINPFTGKKCLIVKTFCSCSCHIPGATIVHFMPCCNDNGNETYIDIETIHDKHNSK